MILKRLFDEKLAQASYIVADDHSKLALIVDPNRDIQQYLDALAADKLDLVAVTETHIHADYVSGSRELASTTGAQLYLSGDGDADWQYAYAKDAAAKILHDGDTFDVGDVRVQALHTPGHTPEHMSFLVSDTTVADEPMGALTGDFIFVGDVGRPDLLERAAGFAGTMEKGARTLFKSLQEFKKRPDYLQIWPGHGAGSACGKALGAMPQSTLGYEKLFNWALAEDSEEEFVKAVLAGQPEPPAYFATMKRINRDGPGPSPSVIPPIATVADIAKSKDPVIDTRDTPTFAAQHMRNSIHIPRNRSFLNWAGSLLQYDRDLLFIGKASEEERRSLVHDLALIGVERIAGVFPEEQFDALKSSGIEFTSSREEDVGAASANRTATILDVRGRAEYEEGHIPNAVNIPLNELQRRLSEVPEGEVVVHCMGGSRSAMAASILEQSGRDDVTNMLGGFTEWQRNGFAVETGNGAH
jgi:hydroxyacylglutathione hydrolase